MFHERLKRLRIKAGLTQAQFAEKANVHFQTVSKWERGIVSPDISMLGIIAEALNVSIEALLGLEADEHFVGVFNSETLGAALGELRKKKGCSQGELAEAVGVSADTVSKWERGIVSPDAEKLIALAAYFAVSPSRIYYGIRENDETEVAVYSRKRRPRLGWLLSLAAVFLTALVTALIVSPKKAETYTVRVAGKTYTVKETDWFIPETPTAEAGYVFVRFVDERGETAQFPRKIREDEEYTAEFAPVSYRLEYWLNGGFLTGETVTEFTVLSEPVVLPVPEKAGDTFEGWFLTADYSGEAVQSVSCAAADVRIYAKWSRTVYSVRYELGGGVCEGNPETVTAEEAVALAEPTKKGYVFLGWYSEESGENRYESVGGAGAKNLVLYALWQKSEEVFRITYHLNGGTLERANPTFVAVGETHRLNAPEKLGHDFIGWNDRADGSGESYVWLEGSGELTLYAIYAPKKYVVRYEYEGMYESGVNPSFVTYGEEYELHPVVTEGKIFVGWYDRETGGNKIERITAENVIGLSVLYARFEPKKYTLTLNANGGVIEGEDAQIISYAYDYGDVFFLPDCTREKYTFLAWVDEQGNEYTQINEDIYGDLTLQATYFLTDGYALSYELDGGSPVGELPKNAYSGQNVLIGEAEKEEYLFLGWNDRADGEGTYYRFTPDTDGESFTLYAIWQEIVINGSSEYFTYEKGVTDVRITGYVGETGAHVNLTVPTYIEGLPVTALGFDGGETSLLGGTNLWEVNSIALPETLLSIGRYVFRTGKITEPIVIPASVTRISPYAFYEMKGKVEFAAGSELTELGSYAFHYANLRNVFVLPEGVKKIGAYSMPRHSLGIILPASVEEIAMYAFKEEYTYGSIYLPEGLKLEGIGEGVFSGRCVWSAVGVSDELKEKWGASTVHIAGKDVLLQDGEAQTVLKGSVFVLPKPEKAGYRFLCWRNAETGLPACEHYIAEKDMTKLVAEYEPIRADGTSANNPIALTLNEETTFTLGADKRVYFSVPYEEGGVYHAIVTPVEETGFVETECNCQNKNYVLGVYASDQSYDTATKKGAVTVFIDSADASIFSIYRKFMVYGMPPTTRFTVKLFKVV